MLLSSLRPLRRRLPVAACAIRAATRRWVGETTGLDAMAQRAATVRRHDPMGPASAGETVIDAYASWGFTVSGVALEGAVLLLPRAAFLFAPPRLDSMTPEALRVLEVPEHDSNQLLF